MSKFYREISDYYDHIFPLSQVTLDALAADAGECPKDVLDVACGSGLYAQALQARGYRVTAVDLDEAMIARLRERDASVDAHVIDMLRIDSLGRTFDFIYCIGNSLVHLPDNASIAAFLAACARVLRPGGKLLIQIINYDRVLDQGIKSLSTIENEAVGLRFERNYTYLADEHQINFNTVLHIGDERLENDVRLHPIRSGELRALLEAAGFTGVSLYGNFKGDAFRLAESVPLVIAAEKGV
ncbi:MAG: class I SAM-dependent methyltransferase [Christensenellales bacterium]|jgi:glycine/sarcosine N-methyltransferase